MNAFEQLCHQNLRQILTKVAFLAMYFGNSYSIHRYCFVILMFFSTKTSSKTMQLDCITEGTSTGTTTLKKQK
jgi:hypothetical protein